MPKKKDHKLSEAHEEETLNKRVDAIMDPDLPDLVSSKSTEVQPIDIFKDAPPAVSQATKTAPEVPDKLLKDVDTGSIEDQATPTTPLKKPNIKPAPTKPEQTPETVPAEAESTKSVSKIKSTELEDQATDRAVEDIAAKESDTMLALQDALGRKASRVAGELAEDDKRAARRKKITLWVLLIVVVVLFLLAVPHISYTCHWPFGIRLRFTTDILPSVCK